MKPSKVIITTNKEYSEAFEYILEDLFNRKIELFCTWGKFCRQWEAAMGLYTTNRDKCDECHHITTTSHSDEPFDDVMNMAELWFTEDGNNEVETIKL